MSDGQTNLTLRQRRRMQKAGKSAGGASNSDGGRRGLWAVLAILLLAALGGGSVWAWTHFHRSVDPRILEIADIQASIAKLGDSPDNDKERRELFRKMREKMDSLPDELRSQAPPPRFGPDLQKFFAMSAEEQLAALQKEIERMQKFRAQREAERQSGQADGAPPGTTPPSNDPNSQSSNGQTANGQGGNGPPRGPRGGTDQQAVQWRQRGLANNPPQNRAQFGLYRQMQNAVMQQQGVSPPGGGGFF